MGYRMKEFELIKVIDNIKSKALEAIDNLEKYIEHIKAGENQWEKDEYEIICLLKEIDDLNVGGGIYSLFERYDRYHSFNFKSLEGLTYVTWFIGTLQDGDQQLMIEETTNYLQFDKEDSAYKFFAFNYVRDDRDDVMYLNAKITIEFLKMYLEREKLEKDQCDIDDSDKWDGKEYRKLQKKIDELTEKMRQFIINENKARFDRIKSFEEKL